MKPAIEVIKDSTHKTRLTITPTRVTLKIAKDTGDDFAAKIVGFAEYVLEQFIDITDDWRGEIETELDGVQWFSVVLRDNANRVRRYQAV